MPRTRCARTGALLALVLMVLLVGGCGGKGSGKEAEGTPTPSSRSSGGDKAALDPGFGVPKVGQCFRMTAKQTLASVAAPARVTCKQPHTTLVAFVGYVETPLTPLTPVAQRRAVGKRVCEPAFRAIVGGTLADRAQSLLTWTLFTPGQEQLERGARWVRCDVLARSGDDLVPLPAANPILAKGVPTQLRVCQDEEGQDVSCSRPHVYRVAAVFRAPGPAYPGVTTLQGRQRCQELTGVAGGYYQLPSQEGWDAGDRFVRCLSTAATAGTATSPAPSP